MNINDLTLNVVKSYAQACRDLSDYIEMLHGTGFDLVVVPSRGAHPLLHAAKSYTYRQHAERYPEFSDVRLKYPRVLYLHLLPTSATTSRFHHSRFAVIGREFLLPLTMATQVTLD